MGAMRVMLLAVGVAVAASGRGREVLAAGMVVLILGMGGCTVAYIASGGHAANEEARQQRTGAAWKQRINLNEAIGDRQLFECRRVMIETVESPAHFPSSRRNGVTIPPRSAVASEAWRRATRSTRRASFTR
jgi:hypothetical protein